MFHLVQTLAKSIYSWFIISKSNLFFCFSGSRRQQGMAVILVISTILFIVLVIQETVFETQVEHRSARAELDALQSYYAAKSGVEIALLRIKAYRKVTFIPHAQMGIFRSYIDMMWRFPFRWPLALGEANESIKNKDTVFEDSLMQARYQTMLTPTAGRLDINDLASPLPSLRQWTFDILFRLILQLREEQKQLKEAVSENDIFRILNNIKDWVDRDTYVGNDKILSEANLYTGEIPPPNRSFISKEGLRHVKGVTNLLYKAIEPFITVYGEKGLNINMAPVQLIRALHNEFPTALAQEIVQQTQHTLPPVVFTKDSFSEFLTQKGFDYLARELLEGKSSENSSVPSLPAESNRHQISHLLFNAPYNFIISSKGMVGKSQKTITAVYMDMKALSSHFNKLVILENKAAQGSSGQGSSERRGKPTLVQPARSMTGELRLQPVIIYWKESS